MGYTTDFEGAFTVTPPLTEAHRAYLLSFSDSRRMKRDAARLEGVPDPVREAAGLPIGEDGAYFLGTEDEVYNDRHRESILRSNDAPADQPGLWCQWVPTEEGTAIVWDGGEKFYNYVEWMQYLLDHFLTPWGYTVEGGVRYRGEDFNDVGTVVVTDGKAEYGHWTATYHW